MLSFDHIVMSLVANLMGLCVVALLKSSQPRLVLYICLTSMSTILIPWSIIAGWIALTVPTQQHVIEHALSNIFTGTSKTTVPPTSGIWEMLVIAWLLIGFFWFILTVTKSYRLTAEWRKTASTDAGLKNFIHESLLEKSSHTRFHRLQNSSIVATTGLFQPEVWIGDRIKSDAHIETALNHELCHIASNDQHTLWMIVLLERLLWWNPLIWLLGRYARRYMEYDCDLRCKALLGTQKYRRSLAELLLANRCPATALEISLGNQSEIINRMENLEMTNTFKIKHAVVLVCAGILLAATSASVTAQQADGSPATLLSCQSLLPEGVKYRFTITSDVDTREGATGQMSVTLMDTSNPESTDIPAGSEAFLRCIQGILGVPDNADWPTS